MITSRLVYQGEMKGLDSLLFGSDLLIEGS